MAFPNAGAPGEIFVDTVSGQRYQYDAAGNFWARVPTPATGGTIVHKDVTIVTNGQSVFSLPTLPTDALSIVANVNGVAYFQPDIVVAGTTINWVGPFALATTDRLVFTYV